MKRGRPKARLRDQKSYGPLGDLIRKYRMEHKMGLLEVSRACRCSVQFISNIEHGRAPLPWDKAEQLARVLKIPFSELQAANLAIRSDFQSFLVSSRGSSKKITKGSRKPLLGKVKKSDTALKGLQDAASLVALTSKDPQLREILEKYHSASNGDRKRFYQTARKLFSEYK